MKSHNIIPIILICILVGIVTFVWIGRNLDQNKELTLTILLKVKPQHTVSFINKMYLDKELKSGKFGEIISITEDPCFGYSCSNYVMIISNNK